MPRCPSCKRHFRVMEDEDDGQHDCPFCGYGREPEEDNREEENEEEEDGE